MEGVCSVLPALYEVEECGHVGVVAIWISCVVCELVEEANRVYRVLGRMSRLMEVRPWSLVLCELVMLCVARRPCQ